MADLLEDEDGAPFPDAVQAVVRERISTERVAALQAAKAAIAPNPGDADGLIKVDYTLELIDELIDAELEGGD